MVISLVVESGVRIVADSPVIDVVEMMLVFVVVRSNGLPCLAPMLSGAVLALVLMRICGGCVVLTSLA